jgi:hypothetical protein
MGIIQHHPGEINKGNPDSPDSGSKKKTATAWVSGFYGRG